jgi:hypothetical protein
MRPLFSSLISKAKQSFSETFHSFDGLASLRLGVVVMQVVSRNRNAYLKRAVIDVRNPMRLHIAYGHGCLDSFHFYLRHRRRLQPQRSPVVRPEFGRCMSASRSLRT